MSTGPTTRLGLRLAPPRRKNAARAARAPFANLSPGTTINVPAGTYNLTISGAGEGFSGDTSVGDLDVTGNNTSIVGAGAGVTIIHQTGAGDRVFEVNPFLVAGLV